MLNKERSGIKPIIFNLVIAAALNSSFEENWDRYLSDVNLPVDSDFYSLLLPPEFNVYSLRETYSIRGKRFHNELIGSEDKTEFDEDFWYALTSKVARRTNFQEASIVVILRNGVT